MKFINKLLCKLLGHKWRPKLKDMYCIRCGTSRPKTFSEYLGYDSLIAKLFSEERFRKYIFNDLQQLHEISQKEWKGDIKDIGDRVKIYDYGNIISECEANQ
jgi:hypothetical protein